MSIPGRNKPSVAVLGPGGVGGLLAALLWRNGVGVTCIVRPRTVDALADEGLHLRSAHYGEFVARPRFVSCLDRPTDQLFITTKADDLPVALRSVPPEMLDRAIIVPLLNGMEHVELLRRHYRKPVVVGMIGKVEARKDGRPGEIAHASKWPPEIELASRELPAAGLEDVAAELRSAGFVVRVLDDENAVIWRKLARLNAIACVTAATNRPLGFAQRDAEWRPKLLGCIREGVMVAQREGVDLAADVITKQVDALPAELTTSLQRSIADGNKSELEAIPGAVLRAAKRHGLKSPTIEGIYESLRRR